MSDEYQNRKDIDKLIDDLYDVQDNTLRVVPFADGSRLRETVSEWDTQGNPLNQGTIDAIVDTFGDAAVKKLALDKTGIDKYNFALVYDYEESRQIDYWIMVNCFYDYDLERFVKIDATQTSFGIQLQATGTYAGEEEIDPGNTGVNVWRNPAFKDDEGNFIAYTDTTHYSYTDVINKNYIGARKLADGLWVQFGIATGWNNAFMLDSYGGMTIGGAGFEVDGNGIFPFTRLSHSIYVDENDDRWAVFGLLDNAYHFTASENGCDSNATYSWFVGLRSPVDNSNMKDNTNTEFIVMYNDTDYDADNIHDIDMSKWHIVFKIDKTGVV